MKKVILILLLFISVCSYSQTVMIKHTNYTTVYDTVKHYPVFVEWWLTKAKIGCKTPADRVNSFAPDPTWKKQTDMNKYYISSGFDRGHMCDDKDNLCQGPEVQKECFYFSNMAPQYHVLNAGSWKRLEMQCRKLALNYDSVHIWAGSMGSIKTIGKLTIPKQCWKVIYILKSKEFHAYLYVNSLDDSINQKPEVTVSYIEQLTGFKFNP